MTPSTICSWILRNRQMYKIFTGDQFLTDGLSKLIVFWSTHQLDGETYPKEKVNQRRGKQKVPQVIETGGCTKPICTTSTVFSGKRVNCSLGVTWLTGGAGVTYFIVGECASYRLGKNNYRCKSFFNSKTISVRKIFCRTC